MSGTLSDSLPMLESVPAELCSDAAHASNGDITSFPAGCPLKKRASRTQGAAASSVARKRRMASLEEGPHSAIILRGSFAAKVTVRWMRMRSSHVGLAQGWIA